MMIDKRDKEERDTKVSQTPQTKVCILMWKGFSEIFIRIFWVNFNFKKNNSYSYIIFENLY